MADYLMMDAAAAAGLRAATAGGENRLDPREAADGRFALPLAVLGDPAFAALAASLEGLATAVLGPGDWAVLDDE